MFLTDNFLYLSVFQCFSGQQRADVRHRAPAHGSVLQGGLQRPQVDRGPQPVRHRGQAHGSVLQGGLQRPQVDRGPQPVRHRAPAHGSVLQGGLQRPQVDRGRAAGQVRVPDQDRTEGGSYREHQVAVTCFFIIIYHPLDF